MKAGNQAAPMPQEMRLKFTAYLATFSILLVLVGLQRSVIAQPRPIIQEVVRQGDDITISFEYREGEIFHLVIGRCGVNSLLNVKALYIKKESHGKFSPWIDKDARVVLKSNTDWIGPYIVELNSENDSISQAFTGGWHGSNGNGTGQPTAWSDTVVAIVDGHSIRQDTVYDGPVRIKATNYVMAYNTIETRVPVLKETATFTVASGVVNVGVTTLALKNVTIYRYYGLQTQDFSNRGKVSYGSGKEFALGEYSSSGVKDEYNIVNKFAVSDSEGTCRIVAGINMEVGLGNFEGINDQEPTIFTEPYGKTYFNLINGIPRVLRKGQHIHWEGYYRFE